MNHLDRGWPSRRQTLNISAVGFLQSISAHVLESFFFFVLLCILGLWGSGLVCYAAHEIELVWKVFGVEIPFGSRSGES